MKRMICEVCGDSDILKNKGAFVCRSCGCKHSLEEARKLLEGGNSIQQTPETLFPAGQTGVYMNTASLTISAFICYRFLILKK